MTQVIPVMALNASCQFPPKQLATHAIPPSPSPPSPAHVVTVHTSPAVQVVSIAQVARSGHCPRTQPTQACPMPASRPGTTNPPMPPIGGTTNPAAPALPPRPGPTIPAAPALPPRPVVDPAAPPAPAEPAALVWAFSSASSVLREPHATSPIRIGPNVKMAKGRILLAFGQAENITNLAVPFDGDSCMMALACAPCC
jgi:hypothetical protein